MRSAKIKNHVILVILDGWGIAPDGPYNAISLAKTPNFDALKKKFGSIEICASGTCVGLSQSQMGNSEVGHLTIGAGREIFQDLMRVNDAVESGELSRNKLLLSALQKARRQRSQVHLLGLLSDGGVHSHINHFFALLKIASESDVEDVKIHVILDGRDTPPSSGLGYVKSLLSHLSDGRQGSISTISGRYYAMDRDGRWERTKLAYDAIVCAVGERFDDPIKAVQHSYETHVTDEFVVPCIIGEYAGAKHGDLMVLFNFRPDRMRQITRALSQSYREFGHLFDRGAKRPKHLNVITLTNYDPRLKAVHSIFGRERVSNTLSNVLERNKVPQLRIAETEKYAHVTYFFNGLVERPRRLEDRILVPSLKIGTYDQRPEMSAKVIAEKAAEAIESGKYGFILVNFANADMVGHSGNLKATTKAVEAVDYCLGLLISKWKKCGDNVSLIVTADHGNAEKMFDERTSGPHTAHTSNPVPLIIASKNWKLSKMSTERAGLIDIAPTILDVMRLEKPSVMTSTSLLVRKLTFKLS